MDLTSELNIRLIGDEILSQRAREIEHVDENILRLGEKLVKMMIEYDGLGLAANQVGFPIRMIALAIPAIGRDNDDEEITAGEKLLPQMMPIAIVNPKIIYSSKETNINEEGCLSVPGIFAEVERPSKIIIEGILNFKDKMAIECGGLLARALQHEIDHLNAILFVQRLDKKQYSKVKAELEKLKVEAAKNNFKRKKNNG